jgi:hypothetical protein
MGSVSESVLGIPVNGIYFFSFRGETSPSQLIFRIEIKFTLF